MYGLKKVAFKNSIMVSPVNFCLSVIPTMKAKPLSTKNSDFLPGNNNLLMEQNDVLIPAFSGYSFENCISTTPALIKDKGNFPLPLSIGKTYRVIGFTKKATILTADSRFPSQTMDTSINNFNWWSLSQSTGELVYEIFPCYVFP